MKRSNRESGQAMVELVFTFPLVILLLLVLTQLAEVVVAAMATHWAARQAARAAAVHIADAPEEIALQVAIRSLAPFLPAVPGEGAYGSIPGGGLFLLRAMVYEQLGRAGSETWAGPVQVRVLLEDSGGLGPVGKRADGPSFGAANIHARVRFTYRLQVPLANRFFADTDGDGCTRTFEAHGTFPVMYAGATVK